VLQSCGTYPHLTVRETLAHWAALYPAPRGVDETIALAGLEEAADRRARTLSGASSGGWTSRWRSWAIPS
jgi:ABC-2 type transport system ATP-binding protein